MQPIGINRDMMETLAAGNHEVFQRVFSMFQPKVHAFAFGLIKNATDADDITQLVFIKLWTNHAKLSEVENLDAYIFGITKNTVLNFIAKNRQPEIDLDCLRETRATGATPQEQIEASDLKLLIDMVVEQMPAQRQTVYRLSREEGLSNDEIAQQLGIQKKTVENHLNLALGEIREMLKILIFVLFGWGQELFK